MRYFSKGIFTANRSWVLKVSYKMGDNGAYKTTRQMQSPNPQRDYVKGQGWR